MHQRYHNKVLDTIHVPQLRAQDQHPTNSSAKSLVSFTERGSKLTRQIFDSSCPGASDGAMLFSNEQLSIAVARWTMLVAIEDDDCTCTLCGEKLPSEEQLKTHKMHCSRKRQVQRHNGIRDAVATMINADTVSFTSPRQEVLRDTRIRYRQEAGSQIFDKFLRHQVRHHHPSWKHSRRWSSERNTRGRFCCLNCFQVFLQVSPS